jgi:hypothetical protein
MCLPCCAAGAIAPAFPLYENSTGAPVVWIKLDFIIAPMIPTVNAAGEKTMPIVSQRLSPFGLLTSAFCLGLLASPLPAQEPTSLSGPTVAAFDCSHPPLDASEPDPPFLDPANAGQNLPNGSSSVLSHPGMFGDLLVIEAVRPVAGGNVLAAVPPVAFVSSFKISENESPRPLDRVFVTGSFYSGVDRSLFAPGGPAPNVYREMLGFEKTFLQGDASVGVRLPYFQLTGDPQIQETRIDDVSVLFKYAYVNNRATGNVCSAGLVVTAPTGPGLHLLGQSMVNPTYFQLWHGGIWNWHDLFVQHFIALAVPTDARDVTLFFKSVAFGYWLYRTNDPDRVLTAIVPDAELHLNTPLNHRGLGSTPIGFPDALDFTGGFYFFFRRAVLGVAAGAPLTGPKPYDYEVNTNLNFRF